MVVGRVLRTIRALLPVSSAVVALMSKTSDVLVKTAGDVNIVGSVTRYLPSDICSLKVSARHPSKRTVSIVSGRARPRRSVVIAPFTRVARASGCRPAIGFDKIEIVSARVARTRPIVGGTGLKSVGNPFEGGTLRDARTTRDRVLYFTRSNCVRAERVCARVIRFDA